MQFLKSFLFNLAVLVLIGIVLFVLIPDVMRQIFEVYRVLLGPVALIALIVAALPRRARRQPRKRRN